MSKALDLIGQRFGKLTVIEKTEKRNSSGQIIWKCQCDCGNFYEIDGSNLKRGRTIHCNQCKKEDIKKYSPIKVGDYINNKKILKKLKNNTSNGSFNWLCQCDCGNIFISSTNEIHRNKKCQKCKKYGENLIGQKFGKLTVIKKEISLNGNQRWLCQCECGGLIVKTTGNLKNEGEIQGCGCLKSKGEEKIAKILIDNNINFIKQKTFEDCFINTGKAIFDFYINNSYIIEYDGIQHFKALGGWNNEKAVQDNKKRDEQKNKYCKEHNIPLIRIPYTKLKTLCLNDLLLETSQFILN